MVLIPALLLIVAVGDETTVTVVEKETVQVPTEAVTVYPVVDVGETAIIDVVEPVLHK